MLILVSDIGCRGVAIGARRDNPFGATLGNALAQLVSIVGFVGEHCIRGAVLQQRGRVQDVMILSLGEDKSGKFA